MTGVKRISFSFLRGNKQIVFAVLISGFLGIATLILGSVAFSCYQSAMQISDENISMKKTINDWHEAVSFIDKQKYRPVKKSNVPAVTSDILIELQSYNLKLMDFKDTSSNSSNSKQQNYRVFMVKFSGDFADTVKFFSNFHSRDALLSIRQLNMTPKNQDIETELYYRIYIK